VRRLIINADDFGFTAGVNQGIIDAYAHGVVTSSTLMANGPAFAQAVELAKTVPSLSLGCHVVLVDGVPLLPPQRVPSLAAPNAIPSFHAGLKSFVGRTLVGRIDDDEITAEAIAQIRRVQEAGIAVTHFDTHKHTHLFPRILRPLLRAARSCGVKALRNPFGPRFSLGLAQLLKRPNLWTRYAEVRFLSRFAHHFHDAVSREGFVAPDGTLGIEVTGRLDESLFRTIAQNIPHGTCEFVCHPGYNDSDLRAANTRLRESRETELRVLTAPGMREALSREQIQLISYADFVAEPRAR
jgi:chitin disaccharide deacetylase